MKTVNILLAICLGLAGNLLFGQKKETGNELVVFATGLNMPVCIANAGDSRLFVVEQAGYIYIVDPQGNTNPVPFLDIHERVTFGGEQGLLGLAFHPQYDDNGYFYVNYTGEGDSTHISRFGTSPSNPDIADPSSEFKIMTIAQPFTNHNGGDLHFGPDGFLYIGMGDGGSAGDPGNRAQSLGQLLGKMLRIDVDQGSPYAVPSSNPFIADLNAREEIWALGLRNPWRFSFDRVTGDMWIGDVGQNAFEEIDFQSVSSAGGENYGWRCYEGFQEYNTTGCSSPDAYTFPVLTYPHGPECSVTGGYVYRGTDQSPYYGYYFFADFCTDRIRTLHYEGGAWIDEEYGQFPGNNFSAFGEDAQGQLYIAGLNSGIVYRVLDNSMGVNDDVILSGVKIIQQASSPVIRIITGKAEGESWKLGIYNLSGTEIFSKDLYQSGYEYNSSGLTPGMYIFKVESGGKSLVRKIVKVN